ncbi:MAG TPA: 3-deoxy-8-phosphooctulonate synthase [Gemmatimonadota bacterium]|nr:3-deoxy-8-phosphooctulonate synthase [Gemmatimonadota bacterium]
MTPPGPAVTRHVPCGPHRLGDGSLFAIAGPDVLEDRGMAREVAAHLAAVAGQLAMPVIFKSSYLKANRSSGDAYPGPGLEAGLEILREVKEETGLPVLTDVHSVEEVERAAEVADVLQVPAYLSRQTFLIRAVARTGRIVNIKKGQFMAPGDMRLAAGKVTREENDKVLLTERGTFFGYHNLVVDMRSLARMRSIGFPVVFDATHSVQLPSAGDGESGGEREFVALLARAAVAAGVDGVFLETHPDPSRALCDAASQWPLDRLKPLLETLLEVHAVRRRHADG